MWYAEGGAGQVDENEYMYMLNAKNRLPVCLFACLLVCLFAYLLTY